MVALRELAEELRSRLPPSTSAMRASVVGAHVGRATTSHELCSLADRAGTDLPDDPMSSRTSNIPSSENHSELHLPAVPKLVHALLALVWRRQYASLIKRVGA
jgi:hypothetical protein